MRFWLVVVGSRLFEVFEVQLCRFLLDICLSR